MIHDIQRWERIQRLLNKTGWTYKKLAKMSGISETTVCNFMMRRKCAEESYQKMLNALEKVLR